MFVQVEELLSKEEEIERSYPSVDGLPLLPQHIHVQRFKVIQTFCIKKSVRISLRDFKTFVLTYVDCCMKQLNSVISAVTMKFNISEGNAVLNWDYSPFGSTVCPIPRCRELADENLKKIDCETDIC